MIHNHTLLTADEEKRATPEALVLHNQRLVYSIARRYQRQRHQTLSFEDLVQEGNIGLLIAARRFDPARNRRFSTYATWWIRQAIGRAAKSSSTVRVPLAAWEQGHRPPKQEHPKDQDFWLSAIPDRPHPTVPEGLSEALAVAIADLPPRTRGVVRARFLGRFEHTLEDVGKALPRIHQGGKRKAGRKPKKHCSRERARQLEQQGLDLLARHPALRAWEQKSPWNNQGRKVVESVRVVDERISRSRYPSPSQWPWR